MRISEIYLWFEWQGQQTSGADREEVNDVQSGQTGRGDPLVERTAIRNWPIFDPNTRTRSFYTSLKDGKKKASGSDVVEEKVTFVGENGKFTCFVLSLPLMLLFPLFLGCLKLTFGHVHL